MRKVSLPKPVIYLGLTSLLTDIASEAIYPILPHFLTVTLGASVLFIGILEGFVEAVSSILKLFSGYFSDRWKKKEPFVIWGYLVSNLLRPFIGFTFSPIQVL
ncbi:MAG: major facilitator superfamily 1, partial [Bacteriovoracaceae bacterium]|nr:major facilitator superfamily 1 [Bacteriovoracaceae bacterium]